MSRFAFTKLGEPCFGGRLTLKCHLRIITADDLPPLQILTIADTYEFVLLKVTKKYIETCEEVEVDPQHLCVVNETPNPACRTPGGMPTATRFLFQFMWAQITTETEPLQEYRVIEKRYRPAIGTVSHITLLEFENGCF